MFRFLFNCFRKTPVTPLAEDQATLEGLEKIVHDFGMRVHEYITHPLADKVQARKLEDLLQYHEELVHCARTNISTRKLWNTLGYN
jgi:hypothetical protein